MKGKNEGVRMVKEFVCQAIPAPAITADLVRAGLIRVLEIVASEPSSLAAALVMEDGFLHPRIELGSGVALAPLFASLDDVASTDGIRVFTFALNVGNGANNQVVAAAIFEWLTKYGIARVRINGVEAAVSASAAESVPALLQALEHKAADGPSGSSQ